MLKDVVGAKTYNVWLNMLRRLVPGRGAPYSIAKESAYEFLKWENMPWED